MSDARTRELERSAAQGDGWARRGMLLAQVRSGVLPAHRVRLAAWLGDPDACALEGGAPPGALEAWARGLLAFEREAPVRAALALGHLALVSWEAWEAAEFAPSSQIRDALEASRRAFVEESEESHADAVEALVAGEQTVDGAGSLLAFLEAEHGLELTRAWRAHGAGLATLACARAILAHLQDESASLRSDVGAAAREVASVLGEARVREAVRGALLPWALEVDSGRRQ